MGGFSQGGAIGKVLAEWMIEGDPGTDIFGMDVARYGKFASADRDLLDTTAQFYARRFVIAYPNEELPAGRPLKTTPSYEAQKALGGCPALPVDAGKGDLGGGQRDTGIKVTAGVDAFDLAAVARAIKGNRRGVQPSSRNPKTVVT